MPRAIAQASHKVYEALKSTLAFIGVVEGPIDVQLLLQLRAAWKEAQQ